jgi:hypothetical protein
MMEYTVPYDALAKLLHDHLARVYGEARSWEEMPHSMQRDILAVIRQALVEADTRGLLRLFPDDGDHSLIG